MLFFLNLLLLLTITLNASANTNQFTQPLQYPTGTISTTKPYFIWTDIYNTSIKPFTVVLKVVNTNDKNQHHEFTISPDVINQMYCVIQIPIHLAPGSYQYSIYYLYNKTILNTCYYHYRYYPIQGYFTIDITQKYQIDFLDSHQLVHYLHQNRLNTLHNGYNALFFLASGIFSLSGGVILYATTNFGIITTVLSTIAISSGVIGISASVYYGIQYFKNKQSIESMQY